MRLLFTLWAGYLLTHPAMLIAAACGCAVFVLFALLVNWDIDGEKKLSPAERKAHEEWWAFVLSEGGTQDWQHHQLPAFPPAPVTHPSRAGREAPGPVSAPGGDGPPPSAPPPGPGACLVTHDEKHPDLGYWEGHDQPRTSYSDDTGSFEAFYQAGERR